MSIFRKIVTTPPHITTYKIGRLVWRRLKTSVQEWRDQLISTYNLITIEHPLYHYGLVFTLEPNEQTAQLSDLYLKHYFDLLGSGWVQVKYGMTCRGLEGHRYTMGKVVQTDTNGDWLTGHINWANLKTAQRIWQLIDANYVPIDWQLDFISGYRWSERTWHRKIVYGNQLGVDVKLPWELARMQHLPQLVYAYQLAQQGEADFYPADVYIAEFRNQILDFIATNPPRYGVNWVTSMDVAIRVANWLITYDLFRACGVSFDADFEREFKRSIYQHGYHIIHNLEWSTHVRGNHYLANIVGLVFVAAYLPSTPEVDRWLAFGIQQLIAEVGHQFGADGANFEASTCYHRLSAEMVVYGTALILGLPTEKQSALQNYDHRLHKVYPPLAPAPMSSVLPVEYVQRIARMAEFTRDITKPNGLVPQIGDNDSGRWVKLSPVYDKMTVQAALDCYANLQNYIDLPPTAIYWDEQMLNHCHLVEAIAALFGAGDGIEADLVRRLCHGHYLPAPTSLNHATYVRVSQPELDITTLHAAPPVVIAVEGESLLTGLTLLGYPDFGLYLFRSDRLYLAMRCGPIGQNGNGGHAHNDQLSIELTIDGQDWITDPGTYVYTSLPERRNEYRSMQAHFVPVLPSEPSALGRNLFTLEGDPAAQCLYFDNNRFVGIFWYKERPIRREILVETNQLTIRDYNDTGQACTWPRLRLTPISPKYGFRYAYAPQRN